MPVLFASSPKARSSVVAPSHTTTDPFSTSDDVGTTRPCLITQIHLAMPDGDLVDISHVSAANNVSIIRASMPKGPVSLGDHFILHPGESLRFVSVGTPPTGTREAVVKGINLDGGA